MSAPPIVLIHGIRTSRTMWRSQIETLTAAGYSVNAIDLPAHGSRLGETFSLEAAMTAIDDAVAGCDGPPLVVGLSLGGYLSLEYAGRHGDRIAGLVAASCHALPRGIGLSLYRGLARAVHRLPDRGERLGDAMGRLFLSPAGARDVIAGGVALDVMDDALGAAAQTDPLENLRRYSGPLWFVVGGLDHFRIDAAAYRRIRPDAPYIVIPRATHLVSLVAPERFTAVIRDAADALGTGRLA